MKKLATATTLLLIVLMISSCLTTLHPLFTAKDLVSEPRLEGTWEVDKGEGDKIIFEKATAAGLHDLPQALQQLADKAYIVTVKNDQGIIEQKYYAFPTRLGAALYLDYYPAETPAQQQNDDFYKLHFVRMHNFYRVRFTNDQSFQASRLKEEYLKTLIKNKQIRIRHEVRTDGSYFITAPTEELQQYVLKYSEVPEAYETSDTYTKIN